LLSDEETGKAKILIIMIIIATFFLHFISALRVKLLGATFTTLGEYRAANQEIKILLGEKEAGYIQKGKHYCFFCRCELSRNVLAHYE
jgi:hypothetical protein